MGADTQALTQLIAERLYLQKCVLPPDSGATFPLYLLLACTNRQLSETGEQKDLSIFVFHPRIIAL